MKGALLGAAAVLLGSAQAGGVHKMKLKKIPLAEQLVCIRHDQGYGRRY
jgi:saccharopepsin